METGKHSSGSPGRKKDFRENGLRKPCRKDSGSPIQVTKAPGKKEGSMVGMELGRPETKLMTKEDGRSLERQIKKSTDSAVHHDIKLVIINVLDGALVQGLSIDGLMDGKAEDGRR